MPYIKLWVHCVWAIKNRSAVLNEPFRSQLFDHIRQYAGARQIHLDRINGADDHLHCLLALAPHQTIEKTVQWLKTESSIWFNSMWGRAGGRLCWQDEYLAVSVSESVVPTLRAYIDGQAMQHHHQSFEKEYQELIRYYGFRAAGMESR